MVSCIVLTELLLLTSPVALISHEDESSRCLEHYRIQAHHKSDDVSAGMMSSDRLVHENAMVLRCL
jgi:hypothetical protein